MERPFDLPRRPFAPEVCAILVCYGAARILEIVQPPIPRTVIVALDVLSALSFALIDGARRYGVRGILVFAAICAVIGNIIENIGVITGFPFGRYYFVELMGPKLFHVPVLLGLAYIGMAYVSWTLASAIARDQPPLIPGARILRAPLLASLMMTSWDLAQDPVWATVLHGWVWRDGGVWFGVPISNFVGWLGTIFVICLLFALYLQRYPERLVASRGPSVAPSLFFYGLCGLGNSAQLLSHAASTAVQDPTGKLWRVADILDASALVSILFMGSFAAWAWAGMRKTEVQRKRATARD